MKNISAISGAVLCVGGVICGGWLRAGAAPSVPNTGVSMTKVSMSGDKTVKVPELSEPKVADSVALMAFRLEKLEASQAALQKQLADLEAAHARHTHTLPFQFGPAKSVANASGPIWSPFLNVQNAQQIKGFKTNPPAK